jgi:hypothetical protein
MDGSVFHLGRLPAVVNWDLNGHPIFGADRSGDVTLAGGVFDEICQASPFIRRQVR